MMQYADISEAEEDQLPLPKGWMRMMKLSLQGERVCIYRSTIHSQLESEEHPYIQKAQQLAQNSPLPTGWEMKEALLDDGNEDIYYTNPSIGISLWDPPNIRDILIDLLEQDGHNPEFLRNFTPVQPTKAASKSAADESITGLDVGQFLEELFDHDAGSRSAPLLASDLEIANNITAPLVADAGQMKVQSRREKAVVSSGLSLSTNQLNFDDIEREVNSPISARDSISLNDAAESAIDGQRDDASLSQQQGSVNSRRKVWASMLEKYVVKSSEYKDKISHRISEQSKPPKSMSGITVLRADVTEANERIHQLLMRLRQLLAQRSGIECTFLYKEEDADMQQCITLASDIITTLRQKPEYVVLGLVYNHKHSTNAAMAQVAFIALHRFLHPFSTDNSMTTAILLQGLNHQLDEMTVIEELFSIRDSQMIISRALFIDDPETALHWNPINAPLPTVPQVPSETVFTCLLRMYSIRRDVTVYFRTIWKPILPAIVALIRQGNNLYEEAARVDGGERNGRVVQGFSLLLTNTLSVANRLLECTLNEKAVVIFPAIATAICRAVNEVGGGVTVRTYLFNLLILPNLLKVLAGDHESAENEEIYRLENVGEVVNKYFDNSFWFQIDDSAVEDDSSHDHDSVLNNNSNGNERMLDPLRMLIWTCWKLYSCAVYMDDPAITVLSTEDFFQHIRPSVHQEAMKSVKASKIRTMIERIRRKIDKGLECLLKLPMDAQGSDYLGVDDSSSEQQHLQLVDSFPDISNLLEYRLSTLHFKPNEMLNYSIVSQQEVLVVLNDVALAMEARDIAPDNDKIYLAIGDYLQLCDGQTISSANAPNSSAELLMQLSFLYSNDNMDEMHSNYFSHNSNDVSGDMEQKHDGLHIAVHPLHEEYVKHRYDQLMRGLKLANRYEDTLLKLIERIECNMISTIFELVDDSTWFQAPEFDAAFKAESVRLANIHTAASIGKTKKSHFGLENSEPVNVFPLFSSHTQHDQHPDIKSMKALQGDVFRSYRFGSTAAKVTAGTSIAREKVLPPAVQRDEISVTATNHRSSLMQTSSRSRYTKVVMKPTSNLLIPTESLLNQSNSLPENPHQKQLMFMQSMRDYEVIPTDQFQRKYHMRQRKRLEEQRRLAQQKFYDAEHAVQDKNSRGPVPFPDHLRHLIRHSTWDQQQVPYDNRDGEMQPTDYSSSESRSSKSTSSFSSSPSRQRVARAREYLKQQKIFECQSDDGTEMVDQNDARQIAHDIIRDYNVSFAKLKQRPDFAAAMSAATTSMTRGDEFSVDTPVIRRRSIQDLDRSRRPVSPSHSLTSKSTQRSRARSPGLPQSMPGAKYAAPTASLLKRLEEESRDPSRNETRMQRELSQGLSPGLRQHPRTSNFASDEVFRPSGPRIHAATGPRVRRVPDFLYKEGASEGVRSRSPSVSSNGRSRSPSPALRRSLPRAQHLTHPNSYPLQPNSLNSNPELNSVPLPSYAVYDDVSSVVEPDGQSEQSQQYPTQEDRREDSSLASKIFPQMPADDININPPPPPSPLPHDPNGNDEEDNDALDHDEDHEPTGNLETPFEDSAILEDSPADRIALTPSNSEGGCTPRRKKKKSPSKSMTGKDSRVKGSGSPMPKRATSPPLPHTAANTGIDSPDAPVTEKVPMAPVVKKRSLLYNKEELMHIFKEGFTATKYGRNGGHKTKLVKYNPWEHCIEWLPAPGPKKMSSITSFLTKLTGRGSASGSRTPIGGSINGAEQSKVSIADIVEIRRGIQTEVLMKAGLVDPSCCVSIVTASRAVDLMMRSAIQRDRVIRGLQMILDEEGNDAPVL